MEEDPKVNLEDQIAQLLGTVEIHINCCEIILDYISSYKANLKPLPFIQFYNKPTTNYLMTICNSHFSEAVSILTSLLHFKKNNEISFKNLETSLSKEVNSEVNELREEFKSLEFLKFRHNIGDHKNKDIIINPLYLNLQFPSHKYLQELKNIFQKLSKLAFSNLDLTWFANVSITEKGLREILNQIEIVNGNENIE